jgi:hypothetical protein
MMNSLPWMSDAEDVNVHMTGGLYCFCILHYIMYYKCMFPGACWQTMWKFACP